MSNREDVERWLSSVPVYAELPDSKALEDVVSLVGHPGFYHLLGLMMGSKQAYMVQLSHIPLNNADAAARASVLQGQIKGIELLRETMLEQFSSNTPDDGAKA